VLGTPTDYYHILEAGVSIWTNNVSATNLGTLFGRMAAPKHFNITGAEVFRYWEANIAGAPLYPDGIKMLVGSFGDLFGTMLGRRLQALCVQQGWVLAWALGNPGAPEFGAKNVFCCATFDTKHRIVCQGRLGTNIGKVEGKEGIAGDDSTVAPYANRTLDPMVFTHSSAMHNLSLASALGGFQTLWSDMALLQNASAGTNPDDPYSPAVNASTVYAMWERLDQQSLGLDFLGGSSCADVDNCVGVRAADGSTCVCYASGGAAGTAAKTTRSVGER
jgi:hypothetical protein